MNDTEMRRLLEQATRGLRSDQEVALNAWNRARRERRRARLAAVGAVVVAVALASAMLVIPAGEDESAPPVDAPTATSPPPASPTVDGLGPLERREAYVRQLLPVVQPAWRDAQYEELPLQETALPTDLDPAGAEAVELASDPVRAAVAVAQLPGPAGDLRVLGDDGGWRRFDVPGQLPSNDAGVASVVEGRPLSPDGTQLAVGLTDGVLLVDLTTGSTREIAVPGLAAELGNGLRPTVQWAPDGQRLLVAGDNWQFRGTVGWLVEPGPEVVQRVDYDPLTTAISPDGIAIELADLDCGLCEIRRHPLDGPPETVDVGIEMYYDAAPAVGDALVVARALRSWSSPRGPAEQNGLLVMDPRTGEPLAMLPTRDYQAQGAVLHGWLDDSTVIVSMIAASREGVRWLMLAWDYRTGELGRLTAEPVLVDDFSLALAVPQL